MKGDYSLKIFKYSLKEDNPIVMVIGDAHIGEEEANIPSLIKYLEKADYIILNGDIMNTATKQSVSFQYGNSPQADLDKAVEVLKPYKDKILCVIEGNHEHRVAKEVGISLTQMMCLSLGIVDRYAGSNAYVFLNVGAKQVSYKIFSTHGYGGGRAIGGKANNLERLASIVDADIYVMSHTHQPLSFQQDYIRPNMKKHTLQQITKHFINTGSFLEYGGYGETFGYKPATIMTPYLILSGTSKHVRVIEEEL